MTEFSTWLKEVMKAEGMSVEEMSRRTGFTTRGIRKWRSGEVIPKMDTLIGLMEAMDLELVVRNKQDIERKIPHGKI